MEHQHLSHAPRRPQAALFPALAAFILGTLIFYLLRGFRIPGGDTVIVLGENWASILWGPNFVYYTREPWCHALAHFIFGFTGDVGQAYVWYSALSGGLFLALLAAWCRRPLAWAILLLSATSWNFVGHIEYYAPFMVTFLLFLVTLTRALEPEPRAQPVHVALTFALAYLFHKLTLFFLPATFWLFFTREGGRWVRRQIPSGQIAASLLILIVMALADIVPSLLTSYCLVNGQYVSVNEGLMDLLTPLTPGIARYYEAKSLTGMFYVYTFGQPKHFAYFFGFLLAGAPLGLAFTLRHWRRIFESPAAQSLALASACGLCWTFMWQPRGFWKDWDLFCLAGMPLNLLGAGLAVGLWRGEPIRRASRREWLLCSAALALFVTGVCIASLQIQAHRFKPDVSIAEFMDSPLLRYVTTEIHDGPPTLQDGVEIIPKVSWSVYSYPREGLLGAFNHDGKDFLISADEYGKIVSVKNRE